MKVLCTSEFYEIHLKLLPKFLKISPLCRKYFGIEEGGLLPSLFQNDEIRGYSFQFLNPFSEEEADWLDDFVRKIKLQPTDPGISSAVDIGKQLRSGYLPIEGRVYLEIQPYKSLNEILLDIRKILTHYGVDNSCTAPFKILEVNQNIDTLKACLKACDLHEKGITPKEIARILSKESLNSNPALESKFGGIYVSKLVRKAINIGDNAFLGAYISEKLIRSNHG